MQAIEEVKAEVTAEAPKEAAAFAATVTEAEVVHDGLPGVLKKSRRWADTDASDNVCDDATSGYDESAITVQEAGTVKLSSLDVEVSGVHVQDAAAGIIFIPSVNPVDPVLPATGKLYTEAGLDSREACCGTSFGVGCTDSCGGELPRAPIAPLKALVSGGHAGATTKPSCPQPAEAGTRFCPWDGLDELLLVTLAAEGYAGIEVMETDVATEIIIHAVRLKDVLGFKGCRARELAVLLQRRFRFRLPDELFGQQVMPPRRPGLAGGGGG
jgi:hypothetical protein